MRFLKKAIILAVIITALVLIFTISASAKFLDSFANAVQDFAASVAGYGSQVTGAFLQNNQILVESFWRADLPSVFDTTTSVFLDSSTLAALQTDLLKSGVVTSKVKVTDSNGYSAWALQMSKFTGNGSIFDSEGCYLYYIPNGSTGSVGAPFLGLIDGSSAVDSGRNYYSQTNNNIAINKNNYDYNTNNITFFTQTTNNNEYNNIISNDYEYIYDIHNGDSYEIGSISYDAGDQYYEVTYVDDNDITQTVYVTYNVQYTIIEYVGLDQTYVCYYELPDGRSSADLTVEDLEFLATGYDIVNYGVESDDIRLRALYHFDGNTADDSYFGFMSDFEWILNPSITYLDAYEWGGCLYLDDLAHQFNITLPSTISTGDFSVMWRMYTGYSDTSTALTSGNVLDMGSGFKIFWNETGIGSGGGVVADLPIGSWCEIAVTRNDGIYSIYVNGLCYHSSAGNVSLGSEITFNFVAATKNTEYIDELRVFNYAIAEAGNSYIPITTPQDTNLVLVLPEPENVVIDNYWTFDESLNTAANQVAYGGSGSAPNYTYNFQDHTTDYNLPSLNSITYEAVDDFIRISNIGSSDYVLNGSWMARVTVDEFMNYTIAYPFYYYTGSVGYREFNCYTSTICLADGSSYTMSFDFVANGTQFSPGVVKVNKLDYTNSAGTQGALGSLYYLDCGDFYLFMTFKVSYASTSGYTFTAGFYPKPGKSIDVSYFEIYNNGSSYKAANSGTLEYHNYIYDLGSLTAPTIAVRSRVPVTDYRIGGVRPTIAEKGMVWMQVENQRITNCLIHDGYGWVQVDIRIWTGSRWAPPSAYDVFTMQDLWDVVGTTGGVLIVDEQGFWYWFVGAWDDLKSWFEQLIDSINALDLSVTIDPDNDVVINVEHDINQWFGDDINDPDIPDNGNSLFDWIKDVFNINAKFKVTIFGDKDAAYEPAWDLLDMFSNTGSPIFGLNNAGDDFWEFDGGGNSAG